MVPHFARDIQYRNWKILTLEKERKKKMELGTFSGKKRKKERSMGRGNNKNCGR